LHRMACLKYTSSMITMTLPGCIGWLASSTEQSSRLRDTHCFHIRTTCIRLIPDAF
jgi:hypothetical protein